MTVVPISPETDKQLEYLTTVFGKKRQLIINDAVKYVLKLIKEGKYVSVSVGKGGDRDQRREHDK